MEAAFPQCSIIRRNCDELEKNQLHLSKLWDRTIYGGDETGKVLTANFIAGSSAEGLALEAGWGHPCSDTDNMCFLGGTLGVHVPQGRFPPGSAALRYNPEGCPPAYCKIEVADKQALLREDMGNVYFNIDTDCIHRSKGIDWLHTKNVLRLLQADSDNISGPTGQSSDGLFEHVPTLVCSDADPDLIQNYMHRPRLDWPSSRQLEVIKYLPMLLVLMGHKECDEFPLQARLSWSHAEVTLIVFLPLNLKQVYIALKFIFKRMMKVFRCKSSNGGGGRSQVGSYHLKTVFLRYLEKRPPTRIWSHLDFMHALLYDFDGYLKKGMLPHYFLPQCNLLSTVEHEECMTARNVIEYILSDPLHAILTCPTDPHEIYADVPPDALVAAFHRVSSHLNCARSCEELLQLLQRLDDARYLRYCGQRELDGEYVCRDKLKVLVDMLQTQI